MRPSIPGNHLPHRLGSGGFNTSVHAGLSRAENSTSRIFSQKTNTRLSSVSTSALHSKLKRVATSLTRGSKTGVKYSFNNLDKKFENVRIKMYRSLNNSSSSGIFKEILNIRRLATNIGGEIDQGIVKRLVGEPAKDILRIDRNDFSIPNKEDFENNLFEHISKTQNRQGFQKRISNFFSSRIETQTNKYNKFQQNEFEGQCKQIFRELVTCLQKGEKPIQYWEDRQETPFKTLAAPRYEGPAQPWDREQ